MKRAWRNGCLLSVLLLAFSGTAAIADDDDDGQLKARLDGFQEVPSISTMGRGEFRGRISQDSTSISYRLQYTNLEAIATQAHIHFGQRGVSGGVIAFLCGGGGKPSCPVTSGTVEGTITAADIIGPAGQGIAPGEFAEVLRAIRHGHTYANVHTTTFPGGEIRGQIKADEDEDDDES